MRVWILTATLCVCMVHLSACHLRNYGLDGTPEEGFGGFGDADECSFYGTCGDSGEASRCGFYGTCDEKAQDDFIDY